MERQLRDNMGFPGTPLRLTWRGKPERERGEVRVRDSDRNNNPRAGGVKEKSKKP